MLKRTSIAGQYIISIITVLLVSAICFFLGDYIHYQVTALLLLLSVSVLAILYSILPVTLAAVCSAMILNFFFIEPIYHYKIKNAENVLLFFIFLLVALVNAVLTNRIKKQEKRIRDKEEKDKTIKLYNTLLNSLSHELRTPISTIIAGIDTLKTYGTMISPEDRDELLGEMEIASVRLDREVGNLLNMNRLETGNLGLKKDWADINEMIFLTIEKFPKASSRIQFIVEENLPLFKVDVGLLEQVIYILIHNAISYTPKDSSIFVEANVYNDHLRLVVADNGSGLPVELKDKVFDKFYRLPNTLPGGSGLGLSIAKGFVEAHQGSIQVANRAEGGAQFTILIPAEVSYLNNLKND